MERGHIETIKVRLISVCFAVLALAVFKPFGLSAWQWEAYAHVTAIGLLGLGVCIFTEFILRFVVRMPRSYERGADYIIRRNLWFQCINTLLVSLMICFYRHWVLSSRVADNQLSWANFLETLIIIGFCSFAIGLYWRYKFRSRYLALELEETRLLNEQLSLMQMQSKSHGENKNRETSEGHSESKPSTSEPSMESSVFSDTTSDEQQVVLTGSTSDTVTLLISDLLYIEAVGNYVKVYRVTDGLVHSDMLRATSKQMEETLRLYPMIVRCHRAFLVNLQQVEKITSRSGSMQLHMKHCNDSIPVSRSNMAQIKEAIRGMLGKE